MYKELIEKFIDGKCTKTESEEVLAYFKKNPLEISNYFSEEEWANILTSEHIPLKSELSQRLYARIEQQTIHQSRKKNKLIKRATSLASIVLLCCIGFFALYHYQFSDSLSTRQVKREQNMEIKHINTTNKVENISLSDGTEVQLYSKSEIRYLKNFDQDKRNIRLKGKAFFKVFKDANRPFTVLCASVATTALGTQFIVDDSKIDIKISLFKGKVVVKDVNNEALPPQYLSPGDEVVYKRNKKIFVLTAAKVEDFAAESTKHNQDYLYFKHQMMNEVLDQLAYKYKVKLEYPTDILSGVAVDIKIDSHQSIDVILHQLAQKYHFKITSINKDSYVISK